MPSISSFNYQKLMSVQATIGIYNRVYNNKQLQPTSNRSHFDTALMIAGEIYTVNT
jgi:hypothetical protein